MSQPTGYYVTYSDDEHSGNADEFTSLFEATCAFYELVPHLETNEVGELGEWLDDYEMSSFLFSYPNDRQ